MVVPLSAATSPVILAVEGRSGTGGRGAGLTDHTDSFAHPIAAFRPRGGGGNRPGTGRRRARTPQEISRSLMMTMRRIACWVTTVLAAFVFLSGGAADLALRPGSWKG